MGKTTFDVKNTSLCHRLHDVKNSKDSKEKTTRGQCCPTLPTHQLFPPKKQKSYFAYLESMWSLCGVMHLITSSEVGSVDESIHTLADRRMVISLMNGAFDQDLNGLLCGFSRVHINSVPFELHNILIIHREKHPRFAIECREE